jgi:hydroxyethylthiazole kinase-like uncharacterized protein yjeF
MQNLFTEVRSLDQRCYDDFGLSEELLMEHAADGMSDFVHNQYHEHESICIVCGAGNNGADGIALARILHRDYDVSLYLSLGVRSTMAKLQYKRAEAVGVKFVDELQECDILIDALFGSGFSRSFDEETSELLEAMNNLNADKIACDMPSGLRLDGTMEDESFIADVTLTMGALKRGMFSDAAKEITGSVYVIDLGVSRKVYERISNWKLLDLEDLHLPHRYEHNSHKGTYGHLSVICGEKQGAAVMTASAALRFGAGLVTLISNEPEQIPCELMQSHLLPETTTAIALGMGLGTEFSHEELLALLDNELPLLLDADIFAHPLFISLLTRKHLVLTPHPKEFTTVLNVCGLADINVQELQHNRFHYVELFCRAYPNVTLLLKGANVIIAQCETFYVNPHGTNVLAKGGSGDVLSGLVASLMAQGHTTIHAALHASLAHTAAADQFDKNSYALTPHDLIEAITTL